MAKEKNKKVEDVLPYIHDGDDLILPLANGEPLLLLDCIEANAKRFSGVRIHQMHALRNRDYIWGKYEGHLKHVAYFLSGASRKAFLEGKCDLVPNHFHEVPRILKEMTKTSLVLACAAPMDEHGYFSLGTQADYVSTLIGKVPFFLEVNSKMPRTFGSNQIHISQIEGYISVDYDLHEVMPPMITEVDRKIAAYVAEQIDDECTIQAGIGAIPNAVIGFLTNHKNLGIHTELLSDSVVDLVEKGIVTGVAKKTHQGKVVTTFALGTKRLYEFIHENAGVEFLSVDIVNDPRQIALEDRMISINATTEVDFFGQCASETVGGKYYSSSGGQGDFARGARFSKHGKGYICMQSTTKNETISRIRPQLTLGSVVTTSKNDVDRVVTEFGVAQLRGKSIGERTKALIQIAHPKFRDELTMEAKRLGFII
ncbi:MAG TPA: acetyl-CoA hydrolase/transferase C-terminal domain-containing protein [Bacillota bacterium]|nr:acetyl-CoA hydrolase/transferase C-terminal domain-containing protein [Bacillota bacterium]